MKIQHPVVLIYKRTHRGDPDSNGVFGIHDCMGSVRKREYDAVIGIGGKRPWRGDEEIALRINWVGVSPIKHEGSNRGPHVTFSIFCLYDDKGPYIYEIAPKLYKHMYLDAHRRVVMSTSLSSNIYDEVKEIIKLAKKGSPSTGLPTKAKVARKCKKVVRKCR